MCFIIKRRVRQMQRKERLEPIIKRLRKPVLYAKEAHEVIKSYLSDLFPEWCNTDPNPMRIVKKNNSQIFYWLHEYQGICYAVKIGTNSELFIAPKRMKAHWFDEIPMSMTIEVVLKDCSRQTYENTTLYAAIFYDADERKISLQTLNLRGVDIRDFPHGYWKVSTVDPTGYDCNYDGCCGAVRFVKASDYYEMNLGGLEIYDTIALWTGSKTLKIFKEEDQGCTIEQMLGYWKKFWEICGY